MDSAGFGRFDPCTGDHIDDAMPGKTWFFDGIGEKVPSKVPPKYFVSTVLDGRIQRRFGPVSGSRSDQSAIE